MKPSTAISAVAALALAFTSVSALAQQGQRGGGNADRTHQVDRDRSYDQDRMTDRDRTFDRDRTQDRDRVDTPDQDRDRDRIQDPASLRDQDIYGHEFMTAGECDQYREQLGSLSSQAAREQYQAQHEEMMQQRALQQGQDLVPPGQGPIYGGELMSVQERTEYREQLRLRDSEAERQQFQAEHRELMRQRAQALDLEIEEAE